MKHTASPPHVAQSVVVLSEGRMGKNLDHLTGLHAESEMGLISVARICY
jgi:hypothetical protein